MPKGLEIKRGEIFFAHLSPVQGSEQGGCRPVLVVQNNMGNIHSPTTIVLAITSQIAKAKLPTHIELNPCESGLELPSVILAEQIRTIDKSRLRQKLTILNSRTMQRVDKAMMISVGMGL